jgi:uncharacterized repeat protein (TIGR03803 family)
MWRFESKPLGKGRLLRIAAALALSMMLAGVGASAGTERALHLFGSPGDGAKPAAPLIVDASGALYGTTVGGGGGACAGGCGTVYKLAPSGRGYVESVLYAFRGGGDGAAPYGGLLADAGGALFGTTAAGGGEGCGGTGCGTVYKLTPTKNGYVESVLYAFAGGVDGSAPRFGSLVADASGALYGTTESGGAGCRGAGCGTVFKLTPRRTGYVESVLYRFGGGGDGLAPLYGVIADARGALFGTTAAGGGFGCARGNGCGTVFSLTPVRGGYVENVLYRFGGGTDGAGPNALIADATGALYGTAVARGPARNGTLFKLTPTRAGYAETTLFGFGDGSTGSGPAGTLLADATGALFGTTLSGGRYGYGTAYKMTPARGGYRQTILFDFGAPGDGGWPQAGLVADARGRLFGTLSAGGSATCGGLGCGAAFELREER